MEEITLQALLEAGCHFGHKSERWNPRAKSFIYTEKDGIHVIDLAQTKAGLQKAAEFLRDLVGGGSDVVFVGTKRQAQGIVKEESTRVGIPYFVERWIGGFLTNWESVKVNIDKIISLEQEHTAGKWNKLPKHEQSKLLRYIAKLKVFYGGVLQLKTVPGALFLVDSKKEVTAFREASRMGIPVVAIVDTNADPTGIEYVIPANDDAVGSIQYITRVLAEAYAEGLKLRAEKVKSEEKKTQVLKTPAPVAAKPVSIEPEEKVLSSVFKEIGAVEKKPDASNPGPKKRGRPKKV